MSLKNRDKRNRFRCITVGFRMSPEESDALNRAVALSGLSKREYCYRKCINRDIVVKGSPRVFKSLKNQLQDVKRELERLQSSSGVSEEWLDLIRLITVTLNGMKEELNE